MAAPQQSERPRRRRSPQAESGLRSPLPVALAAACGLLLLALPLLVPSSPSGDRLKIRRELRKF